MLHEQKHSLHAQKSFMRIRAGYSGNMYVCCFPRNSEIPYPNTHARGLDRHQWKRIQEGETWSERVRDQMLVLQRGSQYKRVRQPVSGRAVYRVETLNEARPLPSTPRANLASPLVQEQQHLQEVYPWAQWLGHMSGPSTWRVKRSQYKQYLPANDTFPI